MESEEMFKQTEIGNIPKDWDISKVGDIARINEVAITKTFPYDKIEYIDIDSVENGIIRNVQRIRLKEAPSRAKRIVKSNDIIISTVRPNLKHFALIKQSKPNTIVSTGFAVISAKKINPKFLYYYLTTEKYTNYLAAIADAHTSAYPSFNPDVIENSLVPLPEKEEQDRIAKILFDIDTKVELNQQMNKNLETIGQALFKHWFIDFEFPNEKGKPYRSSDGEMVDSELGKIPKGWKIKSLDEITERITTGLNPRDNFVLGKGENFYVTIKNMTDLQEIILDNRCDRIDDDALIKIRSRSKVKIGDILFSGIATIGRIFLVDVSPEKWGLSESIFVFKANEMQIFTPILYRLLLSPDLQSYAQQLAIGSVQRGIRMADLKKYKVALPNINDQVDISDMFNRLIKKIKANNHENQALSQIRDSLLPRLMSGKIRVGSAA